MATTHLLIIGDRDALKWVVTAQSMAFSARRSRMAASLSKGDRVLIYTTRGCYRSPARDEGRVMASAVVKSRVRSLVDPVRFSERRFTEGCELRIESLAPYRQGLVLRELVSQLEVFPDLASWGVRLRRPILTLPPNDADLINRKLAPLVLPYQEALDGYRDAG